MGRIANITSGTIAAAIVSLRRNFAWRKRRFRCAHTSIKLMGPDIRIGLLREHLFGTGQSLGWMPGAVALSRYGAICRRAGQAMVSQAED
jgi:hypothetical protein